jgi:hypothetical protein
MQEKYIEQKLVAAVKNVGGIAFKFNAPGINGVPDRLVLLPHGKLAFIELKAPNKKMRPLQVRRKRQLERLDPLSLENIHLKHFLYLKLLCFRAAALDMGPLVSMFHRASQGQLQLTLCGPLPKAG